MTAVEADRPLGFERLFVGGEGLLGHSQMVAESDNQPQSVGAVAVHDDEQSRRAGVRDASRRAVERYLWVAERATDEAVLAEAQRRAQSLPRCLLTARTAETGPESTTG